MIPRLALRSLATRPVRCAVLASGFGFGIAVMAALLGVGEVILEQARSPALGGGGDLVVSGAAGSVGSARFVLRSVLSRAPLAGRVRGVSPSETAQLFLVSGTGVIPVEARGGIPSREKAIGDPETGGIDAWVDQPGDRAWTSPDPGDLLRAMDRFHPIPEVPAGLDSWAEWLYFNGRSETARLYLSFVVGPRRGADRRRAGVRLQLETRGRMRTYSASAEVSEADLLARAPDMEIGGSRVQLQGTSYRVALHLRGDRDGRDLEGELRLDGGAGHSLPPLVIHGAGGWISGYTVPVLAGRLSGSLAVDGESISLEGGTGYHDHNWGFWKGVTWQWGQIAGEGLSIVYGRIHPPADAADAERIPGFLAVLGADGPLGYSTDVGIEERGSTDGNTPGSIEVRARGRTIDLQLHLAVRNAVRRPGGETEFLQLRVDGRVSGQLADRTIDFTAPGSAETFRGGLRRPLAAPSPLSPSGPFPPRRPYGRPPRPSPTRRPASASG